MVIIGGLLRVPPQQPELWTPLIGGLNFNPILVNGLSTKCNIFIVVGVLFFCNLYLLSFVKDFGFQANFFLYNRGVHTRVDAM